jgi:hypothetical protein
MPYHARLRCMFYHAMLRGMFYHARLRDMFDDKMLYLPVGGAK